VVLNLVQLIPLGHLFSTDSHFFLYCVDSFYFILTSASPCFARVLAESEYEDNVVFYYLQRCSSVDVESSDMVH